MFAACLCFQIEDCEAKRMVAPCRFSRTKDFEAMRMVSIYIFRVALGYICTQYLAWSRTEDRPRLDPGSKLLPDQYTKIGLGRKQKEVSTSKFVLVESIAKYVFSNI